MPVELYRTGILFDIIEPIEPIELSLLSSTNEA